ncbi:MAG: hypothetical protein J3R72DRAFT_463476 [Linnemannia gamsii]|nr:MAG: hypothetical protein J3R72DRAFT_463476 [Linnemannia gamsii]
MRINRLILIVIFLFSAWWLLLTLVRLYSRKHLRAKPTHSASSFCTPKAHRVLIDNVYGVAGKKRRGFQKQRVLSNGGAKVKSKMVLDFEGARKET